MVKQADQPAGSGSMPTSGTNRPGPLGGFPFAAQSGVKPTLLTIERLGIHAAIETLTFNGAFPTLPATPETLAWYPRSAPLAVPGVVLIGGSSAIADAGPSAFTRLSEVLPEDIAIATGANGGTFHFAITRSEPLAASPDFAALLQETGAEQLVLLAWNGVFPNAIAAGGVHLVAGDRVLATPPAG